MVFRSKWTNRVILPALSAALLASGCNVSGPKCFTPQHTVYSVAEHEISTPQLLDKLRDYRRIQDLGYYVSDKATYLEDISTMTQRLLGIAGFGDAVPVVQENYFDSRDEHCSNFGNQSRNCPDAFIDHCDQIAIFPRTGEEGLIRTLNSAMHEIGHYIDRNVFNGDHGEKVSIFFERYLHLLGYVHFPPSSSEDGFRHVFDLKDDSYHVSILKDLRSLTRVVSLQDFLEIDDWQKPYMLAHYALLISLDRSGGDFDAALDWILQVSDSELKEMYRDSLEKGILCDELEGSVLYISDFLLSRTGGGYVYEGKNVTEEYIDAFFDELKSCRELETSYRK